jgi:hypothetical protein
MSDDDFKPPYSTDNYDEIKLADYRNIFKAFKDKDSKTIRLEIIRYLAQEAREKNAAKTYSDIVRNLKNRLKEKTRREGEITLQAVRKHCEILKDIGIIAPTRSRSHDPSSRDGEYIAFYLVVQNLIAILTILSAGMLGLPKEAAKRIEGMLTKEFETNPKKDPFRHGIFGIYAHGLSYLQAPAFDTLRNIVYNYIQIQKDVINSWSGAAEEFNLGYYYYYPWFYPAASLANMASKTYRSIADYAISGLNIAQNNFDAYIDMSKTYSKLVDNNINELSCMALNYYSKLFEPMPQASTSTKGGPKTSATITSKPPPDMEDDEEDYDLSELRKLIDELTEIKQIALSSA